MCTYISANVCICKRLSVFVHESIIMNDFDGYVFLNWIFIVESKNVLNQMCSFTHVSNNWEPVPPNVVVIKNDKPKKAFPHLRLQAVFLLIPDCALLVYSKL